jgi:hypothetical protein
VFPSAMSQDEKKGEHAMMSKKNVLIWAFAAFAGMLFAVAPNVQGDAGGRVRLDGAWLVTSPAGIRGVETITALDPSGKSAAVRLNMLSADATGLGCCPDAEYLSVAIGEAVMTGPSTFEATLMNYSMRAATELECKPDPPTPPDCRDQVVCIWVVNVSGTVTEDTQDTLATLTIYPSTDVDGDMLPDENDVPCLECLPMPFMAKRVPMASCE